MADIFSRSGLIEAGKRTVRTFAQGLAAGLIGATIVDVDWRLALGGAALTALVTLLHNVADDAVTTVRLGG